MLNPPPSPLAPSLSYANAFVFGCQDANGNPVETPLATTVYHSNDPSNNSTFTTGGRESTTITQVFNNYECDQNCKTFLLANCRYGVVFVTVAQVDSELANGHAFPTYTLQSPFLVYCN